MKCIHADKVIPDFVVEPFDDGEGHHGLNLVSSFDYASRSFLRFCMSNRDLGSEGAPMREFMQKTEMIQKTWWDQNLKTWVSSRFTPQEYLDLVKRSTEKGFIPQYGKPKWPTGGGRAARAAGKFFYAKEDVMDMLYHTRLHIDPSKLDAREKVARAPIVLGDPIKFAVPPVIKFTQNEMGGIVLVDSTFAANNGLNRGDKLWPIKASVEIIREGMNLAQVDMVIPADANKFKEHAENPEVLASLLGVMPDLTALARSSKAKDRMPKLALDVMQWLFPEIGNLMDTDPVIKDRLGLVRSVVEGSASIETMMALGEYKDASGQPAHPMEFTFLQRGQPLEERVIRDAVFKAAGTAVTKALCFKIAGQYGVAMPARGMTRRRLAFCPPWMLPFWVDTDLSNPNVCGIDTDWMIGCLGKDYDGDLLMIIELNHLFRRLNLDPGIFPDWTKMVPKGDQSVADATMIQTFPDREWSKQWLRLPVKQKGADPRTVHEVMVDGLKGYGLIGRATNMCMVVLDALRAAGTTDRRTLMGIYLKMMSTEVQQFVDSIKYTPGGLWAPRLEDFKTKKGRIIPGMASRYGVDVGLAMRVRDYFRAVRAMDFDALASLPEDETLKGSFYYKIASLFHGWKPVARVSMTDAGKAVATSLGVANKSKLDMMRRQSFVKFKKDIQARLEFLAPVLTTPELTLGLAARAWANRDILFALELEKLAGKRVIDVYKEALKEQEAKKIQVPPDPECDPVVEDC
jgi:hypothetical protein